MAVTADHSAIDTRPLAADPYEGRPARQWRLVIFLMLLMMLATIDRQIISLLTNPIKATLGLTDTQISIIYGAAFALANIAFTLPAGYLADRVSRRMLVGVGGALWSIMTTMCGVATGYWQLLFARAGVGGAEGVIGPCSMSMLRGALSPERRGRGFAVFNMATMGGSALALILGGMLMGIFTQSGIDELPLVGTVEPWQMVLIVLGLAGMPLALLMLFVQEPLRRTASGAAAKVGEVGATFKDAWAYIWPRKQVYIPLFAYQILASLGSLSFGAWIAPMIQRKYGIGIPEIGAVLGVMMLIFPPTGLFIAGYLIDRFGKGRVDAICKVGLVLIVAWTVTAVILPQAPALNLFWVLVGSHMLFSGSSASTGATIQATITPGHIIGKVSSLQFFLNGIIAVAVGPFIVALVSDNMFAHTGNESLAHALSLVTGIYGTLGLIALLFIRKGARSLPADEQG
jgi:MFS transporter, Spinster family, sphingosine-1-phosphate transporter